MRFITIEDYNGSVVAMNERENWKQVLVNTDAAAWVWQFAANKAQAISQHYAKHAAWEQDADNGDEKNTY